MAFTEKYVTTTGAGAHDGSTEIDAWSLAEMIAAAPGTGDRVNIKAGSYSSGSVTWPAGAAAAPVVFRGYNSTIGDLDSATRSAAGPLTTTNFPTITCTNVHTISAFSVFQNLIITGAVNGYLLGSSTADNIVVLKCALSNTNASSGARTINIDDGLTLIMSDFSCSGAGHAAVAQGDSRFHAFDCRFKGISTADLVNCELSSFLQNCVFIGSGKSGGNKGINMALAGHLVVTDCTFYNLTTAISLPNAVNTTFTTLVNNHCTDCGEYINSLYSGTASVSALNIRSRTRDNTTESTGLETVKTGEITTDNGDASTDYTDTATDDFRLIVGAAGRAAGVPTNRDCGAMQSPAGGSGGGSYAFLS